MIRTIYAKRNCYINIIAETLVLDILPFVISVNGVLVDVLMILCLSRTDVLETLVRFFAGSIVYSSLKTNFSIDVTCLDCRIVN